jgi:hypothetical protein
MVKCHQHWQRFCQALHVWYRYPDINHQGDTGPFSRNRPKRRFFDCHSYRGWYRCYNSLTPCDTAISARPQGLGRRVRSIVHEERNGKDATCYVTKHWISTAVHSSNVVLGQEDERFRHFRQHLPYSRGTERGNEYLSMKKVSYSLVDSVL